MNNEYNNTPNETQNDYYWNPDNDNKENKPPKKSHKKQFAACFMAIAVVGAGVGIAWAGRNTDFGKASAVQVSTTADAMKSGSSTNVEKVTVNTNTTANTTTSNAINVTDVSAVVDACMPSVVAITSTTIVESGNYGPWGSWGSESNQYEQQGAGSGIIIAQTDSELLILTNNHVVEGATKLSIQFSDGKSVEAAVKGTDADSDLAVVAIPIKNIEESTLKAIKIATLGDSDQLKVGEGVVAIGNALGYGQSVTSGVISALDREVQSSDGTTQKMIQTDAAINGGNSGGALINSKGEVIGINAAKYSSSGSATSASIEGMGFAIPVSSSTDVINNLMNQETRTKVDEDKRGYLGITCDEVDENTAEAYGIPKGILVNSVEKNGAADEAGITRYDVITAIDGSSVSTFDELKEKLSYYAVGDKVKVTISYRDGKEYKSKDVTVKLQKNTSSSSSSSNNNSNSNNQQKSQDDILNDFFNGVN